MNVLSRTREGAEARDPQRRSSPVWGASIRRAFSASALLCVVLALTACSFFVDQGQPRFPANPDIYRFSAGDGVNIEGLPALSVRNALVVANEDGTEGNFIAAIVNDTSEEHVLYVQVGEGSRTEFEITVPGKSVVSYGQRPSLDDPVLIEDLEALPGSMVEMRFRVDDSEGVVAEVPVLNGCLDYLRGLEPDDPTAACPPRLEFE